MIEAFDTEAGYRAAIDATLRAAQHEIRIFDHDLARMALNDAERHALLANFLAASPARRLHVVLHDPGGLSSQQPRLLHLLRRHGHQIEIRQSPEHLRMLSDQFVLADQASGAVRFHANQARGKQVSDDAGEISPLWQRFDELWEVSQLATPSTAPL